MHQPDHVILKAILFAVLAFIQDSTALRCARCSHAKSLSECTGVEHCSFHKVCYMTVSSSEESIFGHHSGHLMFGGWHWDEELESMKCGGHGWLIGRKRSQGNTKCCSSGDMCNKKLFAPANNGESHTQPPQTKAPQTQPPPTKAPHTQPPSTEAPTTQPPQTEAPQSTAPSTKTSETHSAKTQAHTTASPHSALLGGKYQIKNSSNTHQGSVHNLPTSRMPSTQSTMQAYPSATLPKSNEEIECHVCSGGTCGETEAEPTMKCPTELPYCMNVVQSLASGSKFVTKRCAMAEECKHRWLEVTAKNPACLTFDPAKVYSTTMECIYCCNSSGCNDNIVPRNETLVV